MANKEKKITQSQIRYILAIRHLSADAPKVRSIDIAERLGYAKPSVHKMMETLQSLGYIHKEYRGAVVLTEEGQAVAERYAHDYAVVCRMLRRYASDEELQAGDDAAVLAVLSELSAETLASIAEQQEADARAEAHAASAESTERNRNS